MSTDPMGTPDAPQSRRWLIIVVVVVVVCCLCLVAGLVGWYLYSYGDQLLGLAGQIAQAAT